MKWLPGIFSRAGLAGASGDRLGIYPAERDVPALEGRRYLWTARAFAVGMFLSLCLNAVLAFAIASLSPLVRVEPMLLSFKDRNEQLVRVEPFSKGTRGFELMSEMLVRDYVLWREEIVLDENEMRRRWGGGGVVAYRSDPEEYRRFVAAMAPRYEDLRQKHMIRNVVVHRVAKISDGYWQVEFTTSEVDPLKEQGVERTWIASLSASYLPTAVHWEDRYMNPLGFVVLSYSVTLSK